MKKLILLFLLLFAPYASAQGPFSAQIVRYGNQFHLRSLGAPYTCNSTTEGHSYADISDHNFYYCNGTNWLVAAGSGGAGNISGAGAAGRVTLFSGAQVVTSDTGFTYTGTGATFAITLGSPLGVVSGGTNHSALTAAVTAASHAFTCNFATAKRCVVTLQGGGADTATFSNGVQGETYLVILLQPAGSDGTVTWPASVYWPGDVAPTLTTTDSKCDMVAFVYNGVGYKAEYSLNYATAACTQ